MARPGQPAPGFFDAYVEWMQAPPVTWSDLAWVREQWSGKLVIKGITHPDDARHAVDVGADAISVSNHGGNNLDGTPASIRALPGVADAVDGQIEVLLDGGIRRGSDVVKAVALGAHAVMIGRAALWGLAASGERGVANVLEILRAGIDETLIGLGKQSLSDLGPADLVVPERSAERHPRDAAGTRSTSRTPSVVPRADRSPNEVDRRLRRGARCEHLSHTKTLELSDVIGRDRAAHRHDHVLTP